MYRLLVAASPGERRIALMQDGVLTDYALWRPGAPDGVGDLHVGRVIARVPAMAGSFVALADAEAFLPDSACPTPLTAGTHVTVRVTRAAQSGKGPRVAAEAMAADGPVRLLAPGPSPLDRLAAAFPDAGIAVDSSAQLAALRPAYGERIALNRDGFGEELESEIAALAEPAMALPQGMRATIVPTAALTAIDLDAGAATGARAPKSAAQLDANLAAIPALARQIRLRNLSGAILIDFAGMPAKRRRALAPALETALAADKLAPRLLGFTQLGFAEILRPRMAPPLHELLRGPHAAGLRALHEAISVCQAAPACLRAAPAVMAALTRDQAALAELANATVHPLMLKSDPTLPADTWMLEDRRA